MNAIENYYKNSLLDDLCTDYRGRWQRCHDKESLLKLSLSRQAIPHVVTYAYQGRGLTKDFVLNEYSDLINGYAVHDADGVEGYTTGLYVDYDPNEDLIVDKDTVSIMWTVGASVVVPETKATTIYVSNKSKLHLVCEGYNSVSIYLFDKSEVTIDDVDEESAITIYRYCKDAKVDIGKFCLSQKIRVFDKQLKL